MAPIDVAMAQSLHGGMIGTVKRGVFTAFPINLWRRDIISSAENNAEDIKRTFTNWNLCMTKDYCKWPAIGVIVLLSLIIIGITICTIRCCCLGLSCCCSCFRCLKCCGNCCGCCDAPGDRPHKYSDEPFNDRKGQGGYRQQAPMEAHFPPPPPTAHSVQAFNEPPQYPPHFPPQYAEFDVKKSDPDSLPSMPVWDESKSKQMPVEEMEMDNLPKKEQPTMQRMPPQRGPMPGHNNYNAQGKSYGHEHDAGRMSDGLEYEQSFGNYPSSATNPSMQPSAAIQHSYGPRQGVQRQATQHNSMQATVFELDHPEHGSQNPYGTDYPTGNSGPPQNGYGNIQSGYHSSGPAHNAMTAVYPPQEFGMTQERFHSPVPAHAGRRSPASREGYGGNLQQRFEPPISPPPMAIAPPPMGSPRTVAYRTYSPAPRNAQITNNGGFDFNSGYSRPQNHDEPETPGGYPGYKPYNPASPTPSTFGMDRKFMP